MENVIPVEGISINKKTASLGVGGPTLRLTASVIPETTSQRCVWSSSDTTVATVDEKGIVTPVGKGNCIITATSKYALNIKAQCQVKVLTNGSNISFQCYKDGELWSDETKPVITVRAKADGETYADGDFMPAGTGAAYMDGEMLKSSISIPDDPTSNGYHFKMNFHTVRFLDEDGSVLYTQYVFSGKIPTYKGPVPTKKGKDAELYSHAGWKPKLTNVYSKTDYRAVYKIDDKKVLKAAKKELKKQGYILQSDEKSVAFQGTDDKTIKSFKIPASVAVNGRAYAVTKIADNAFLGCTKLTSLTIGKNVRIIGNNAFKNCKGLKTVTIPAKVSKIGSGAFYGCKKLKKVTVKSKQLSDGNVGSKAFGKTKKKMIFKVPKAKKYVYNLFLKKKGNKTAIVKS